MPIDRKEFENANLPLEERIMAFLIANPDRAFTLLELISGIEKQDMHVVQVQLLVEAQQRTDNGAYARYAQAIGQLTANGSVSAAQLRGETYYALSGG